jgi:transcriptional regulator with PAS, ATPase and Fis domain
LGARYSVDNIMGGREDAGDSGEVERAAPTRATVLLAGESGVGKD